MYSEAHTKIKKDPAGNPAEKKNSMREHKGNVATSSVGTKHTCTTTIDFADSVSQMSAHLAGAEG